MLKRAGVYFFFAVLVVVAFAAGWFAALRLNVGEQALGNVIEVVSAVKFLEKNDRVNAIRTLQLNVEGNLLKVDKYGTPILDWYDPNAKSKWIQRYADIRGANPKIEYQGGEELGKRVDEIIAKYRPSAQQ